MAYEKPSPNDHAFVRVKAQTGCKRCGYAKGHHPTAAMVRAEAVWERRAKAAGWVRYLSGYQEFSEQLDRIQYLIGSICYESQRSSSGDWWIRRVS